MGELARDRAPLPAGISIESRRLVSAADEQLLARAGGAVRALGRLDPKLPAVMHQIRDVLGGQPRAAASHREGDDEDGSQARARLWCEEHERTVVQCDAEGLVCTDLSTPRGISDPVGLAATSNDPAAADLRRVRHLLDQLVRTTLELVAIADAYPTTAIQIEKFDASDLVGTEWCRCCWKDDKYCEPIALRTSGAQAGKPYFSGLCLWCGRMKNTLGFDPPTWMVELHHRGERIGPGLIEKAMRERPAPAPKKGKKRK